MTTAHDDLILQVAGAYGLPFDLLQSQVVKESSGHADAFRYESAFYERYMKHNTSALGFSYGPLAACSYGLLQVMLETALEVAQFDGKPSDLFVPRIGLTIGAKVLKAYWDKLGGTPDTYKRALARYNGTGEAATQYADAIYVAAGRTS